MIYIIRHGQTEMNSANALQGRSDLPLNDTGIAQAREAGELFRSLGIAFRKVVSSPLRRAVQTAQLAAGEGAVVATDDRLIEMDYGPYEGVSLNALPPEILTFFSDFAHNPAPEGMEQLASVVGRLGAFLEDLRAEAAAGDILVSTHAIAMKGALEYLNPASRGAWWSTYLGNCAIYRTEPLGGAWLVPVEVYGGAGKHPGR